MSEFMSKRLSRLKPYVPGEQPKDFKYIKLNTNENPYPPSEKAVEKVTRGLIENLRLYSDPDCTEFKKAVAEFYKIPPECVVPSNGSDEALAFCFAAFGESGVVFPDVTYGFYKVFSELFGADYKELPLNSDFSVNVSGYLNVGRTVFLANPNAQTGAYLKIDEIERIIKNNPKNVVVIDEAYIDFGGESAVPLTQKYDNLVVVQTLSKSRSFAGARLGFAVAGAKLAEDLNAVRCSFNPYNVNSVSAVLGAFAMRDIRYFDECRKKVITTRVRLINELKARGYSVLPSLANFVLAKSPYTSGEALYLQLKDKGILVRHFKDERITDYIRITIGTDGQTDALLSALDEIEGR